MTHPIWTDLCNQPTQPVSTEKYAKIVYDSTTQLHQPVQSILSTLDRRAMALTKLAYFESALCDAKVMQQISPSSPLGYIRAAIIYSQQGKQRDVIDICSKGLDIVDTKDTDYATLQQIKADAMERQDRRIDFITQLPYDIATTMLLPLLMDDSPLDASLQCPYLYVSNQWRDCILQYSNGLRFETGYNEEQADPEHRWQLVTFARHIKALHLRRYSKRTWLSDLLRDNDFCSLREIYIDEFATEMYDFVASLQSIGSRLTHLAVYEIDGAAFEDIIPEDTFPVAKILSSCPNLVSFSVIQQDAYDFNLLPMATWSNMTTLTISSGATLTRDHIISICQRFPSLKKLDLCPCDSIESALMIPRFCPTLKSVEIDIQDSAVGVIYSDCSIGHQEELTVTKLSVLIDWTWDDMFERTATLIQQHHTTLEDIQWIIAPAHDHQGFYSIQYPRLKKLSVNFGGWWILLNAPIVEDLFLASPSIIDNPQVLDTIPPNLKALELRLNEGPMPVNRDTIEQYLYRVSQQCHLQELAIHFDNLYNLFRTRGAITRFNTLQCLVVGFDDGWDHNEMERFFDAVVIGCPDLSSLEISCGNSPSTYSINALKQLRHLEQMTFSIEDTDGYDSFWNAIRTFSHLKRIRIYPADQVNHAEIRRLKEQRRDMKIIVDDQFERF